MCSISANFVNDILNKPDDYYLPICYLTFGNYDKNIPFFARNSFLDFNYRILSYYNIPINIRNLSDDWNFLIFFKMIISAHYSLFEGSTGCGISFVQYRIFSNAKFLLRKVLFFDHLWVCIFLIALLWSNRVRNQSQKFSRCFQRICKPKSSWFHGNRYLALRVVRNTT